MKRRILQVAALATNTLCLAACSANRSADLPPAIVVGAPDSLIGLVTAHESLLDSLETREYGYEERALAVYARRDAWFLVGTRDSARTWIRAAAVDSFMPLDSLLHDRLAYLTDAWDGALRVAPAFNAARVPVSMSLRAPAPDADQTPARVLRTRRMDDAAWWAEVEVMNTSGCDDDTPRVLASGWVPLWGTNRAPTVWYFSRGC